MRLQDALHRSAALRERLGRLQGEFASLSARVAADLAGHPAIRQVFYPGLESQQNHTIARTQMSGFGGMLSVDVGTAEAAKSFVNRLKLCTFGTSLGGVETIVQPVALMTHATLSPEERAAAGISEGLLRISVGIEHFDDIRRDIYDALD